LSWLLAHRPELPVHLISDGADGLKRMKLSDRTDRLEPFHFELFFGKERDPHDRTSLDEAARTARPVCRSHVGFYDLFYPLTDEPRAFLYIGPFYRAAPDWENLSAQWRELTGQEPTSANPDFAHFVRMALALPVLEDDLLDAYKELLVDVVAGREDAATTREKIDRLWPTQTWIERAIDPDKFKLMPLPRDGRFAGPTRRPPWRSCHSIPELRRSTGSRRSCATRASNGRVLRSRASTPRRRRPAFPTTAYRSSRRCARPTTPRNRGSSFASTRTGSRRS
jgi:hypothetical protein